MIRSLGVLLMLLWPVPAWAQAWDPLLEWQVAKTGTQVRVEDGVSTVAGPRGWIRTTRGLTDFVLRIDVRLNSADTVGAVLVRAWTDQADAWAQTGYRVGLVGTHTDARFTGQFAAVSGSPLQSDVTPPAVPARVGEWQTLQIRCEGDTVTVVLDGVVVQGGAGRDPHAGYIGVELDSGQIDFRNAAVRPLRPVLDMATAISDAIPGFEPPVLESSRGPVYTPDAMRRRVSGVVIVSAIVDVDGSVRFVNVTQSLDPGLDAESIAAVRRWRLKPARLGGTPIPVRISVDMNFKRN